MQTIYINDIYEETSQVKKYKTVLLILSAAILPMYLSMFRYNVFGATLRIADVIAFLVIASTFVFFPKYFLKFIQLKYIPMWLIFLYIIFQGMFLENTGNSVKEGIQILWVCLYLGTASTFAQWDSQKFYKWTIIFLAISALYTMLFHITQGQFTRYKLANDGKYAFGLLSVLLLLKADDTNIKKDYFLFIVSLLPLALSLERKGIFGVLLIFILILTLKLIQKKPQLKGVPIFFAVILVLFLPYLTNILIEFIDEKIYRDLFLDEQVAFYTSNLHRESLLINSYQIIRDHPYFGVGADKIMDYMELFYFDSRLSNGAHNFYIDGMVKYGIIGFSLFLLWPVILFLSNKVNKGFSEKLILFNIYCLFVVTFMADGQAVLIVFLFSFLNPYLFKKL